MSPRYTVLIVDDDDDLRAAIAEVLVEDGYDVGHAGNGAEALNYLHTQPRPDLILLDLMMPVMDGREFRCEQRRDPRLADIPVVVLTAAGNAIQQVLADGECIVHKPIRREVLLQLIKTHIV